MQTQDINAAIARNLKDLRKVLNISISELAERTGVSKSMIGQIERGESSPTVATLCKISSGLNIPFNTLIQTNDENVQITKEAEIKPQLSDHGHFRLFPLVPIRFGRNYEMYDIIMDPGTVSGSPAHDEGSTEYLFVYEGEMTVAVETEDNSFAVNESTLIQFPANQWHEYRNDTERIVRAVMIVQYNRN